MDFDKYIGIDYSGAATPRSRSRTLQVYAATDGMPERVTAPAASAGRGRNWCRAEIAEWLVEQARSGRRFIAGLDHGFSFPRSYFTDYGLTNWHEFLDDLVEHWPAHEDGVSVESLREKNREHTGDPREFRTCEKWTNSAKSVFDFAPVQGIVAKSTHAGIPWLWHIRNEVGDRVHFWPFDGWDIPGDRCVIAEAYPTLFRRRFEVEALELTSDELDAYVVSRWLKETCENGLLPRCLNPPLTERERQTAELEGWILGIA